MAKHVVRLMFLAALAFGTSVAHGANDYRLLKLGGHLVKWGSSGMGAPATVTYAYVPKRSSFPRALNCREMVPLDGLLAASGIPPARFRREAEAALRTWEAVAGITFRRTTDAKAADILIGAQAAPRRVAFANVSYSESRASGPRRIEQALICLNPTQLWQIGFDGEEGGYDVRHVITHEAGHAIGLDHPDGDEQMMSFRYPAQFRGLQAGDIDGAIRLYGRPKPALPAVQRVKAGAADVTIRKAN